MCSTSYLALSDSLLWYNIHMIGPTYLEDAAFVKGEDERIFF